MISNMTGIFRKTFNKCFPVINFIVLFCILVVTAYPFLYILFYSLSDPSKVGSELLLAPIKFTLESYKQAFASTSIFRAMGVSIARSFIGACGGTFITLLVAYGLSKKNLVGRKALSIFFIITMYLGAGMIPVYLLIKSLNLVGTFWVYIIPGLMSAYNMILIRSFIESMPEALFESAYIDGANDLHIFFKLVMPLSVPVLASVALFSCVGHWNSYTDTLIYNASKPNLYTLQYVLMTLVDVASQNAGDLSSINGTVAGGVKTTPMSVRMSVTIIAILPISLVYPFLQRYFIKGIMLGAVKG